MSPVAFKARLAVNPGAEGSGNGPDSTDFYVEVTVASSQVGTTLTSFPVYVDLNDLPATFFNNVQSDGGDIRVTENDGTTRCAADLVSINTGASTGELHFLASSLSSSSDTTFRIYYGYSLGTLSQPAVGDTYGRNAVWSNYAAVYHGDDTTDSTGNGNTLTASGDAAAGSTTAKMGDAFTLDGTGDYLTASDDATLDITGDLSISMWLRNTGRSGNVRRLVSKYDTGGNNRSYSTYAGSNGKLTGAFSDDGSNLTSAEESTASITASSTWKHAALTFDVSADSGGITAYVNGASRAMSEVGGTGTSIYSGASVLILGDIFVSGSPFGQTYQGQLDEVRIGSGLLSGDWISSEYVNQNTPTTFYTIGSQQVA